MVGAAGAGGVGAGAATVLGVAHGRGAPARSGVALAEVTAVVVAHRRAQAAADLAALAGAGTGADPCAAAASVAEANGARLVSCEVASAHPVDLVATVRVEAPPGLGRVLTIEGRARAGPGP